MEDKKNRFVITRWKHDLWLPGCETFKEKYTHTFEVDLNNEQVQKQRCEYIEQIHALPTRLFMYNPKTDEYIELKP